MGKFSLLSTMVLDASGYVSGIEDAKKSTQSLVKGTDAAVNGIGSQFSKLGGFASGVTAPLAGIQNSVMLGVNSFKTMIPAINGVKVALISSGIGAIVVVLGLAFAALSAYLGGTSEGSNKLRESLGYISGAITALMNRFKHFGEAVWNIMHGDWDGFKKGMSEAFKSGFFDEVVEAGKKQNAIEEEITKNKKVQRDLITQVAGLELEASKLNQKARDPKLDAETRLKYLNQMLDVEDKIAGVKTNAAKLSLKIAQDTVANKGFSANGEDKDAVARAQANIFEIEKAKVDAGTRAERLEGKLLNSIQKEKDKALTEDQKNLEIMEKLKNESKDLDLSYVRKTAESKREAAIDEVNIWKQKEIEKVMAVKATTDEAIRLQNSIVEKIKTQATEKTATVNKNADIDDNTEKIKNDEFYLNLKSQLYKSNFDAGLIDLQTYRDQQQEAIKQANEDEINLLKDKHLKGLIEEKDYQTELDKLKTKQTVAAKINSNNELKIEKSNENAKLQTIQKTFGEMGTAATEFFGKQSVEYKAFAIAQASISTWLGASQVLSDKTVPFWLKPIAMATIIGMGLANISHIAGFKNGGIVGGSAFSGDNIHAKVNSGEMILNRSQQSNLFAMANGGSSFGGGGEVRFEIEGTKLVGVLANHNRRVNNFR